MRANDFLSKQVPGQMTVQEVIKEVEAENDVVEFTSLTPSGIEVYYSPAPRRHYKVRYDLAPDQGESNEWQEVPSVTNVLGVLDKPALPWWGMKVGVEGVLELARKGIIVYGDGYWSDSYNGSVDNTDVVKFLTQEELTVNHVKDKAADRGTNVHSVLEAWSVDQDFRPDVSLYEEHERGYVEGLVKFLDDFGDDLSEIESEVMVGSIAHGFAGRYDTRLTLERPCEMAVRCYPKRKARMEEIPAGKYLLDLKTSKSVYDTHALQLAAYELASVECGYGATDHRAVIHVTQDGQYELVRTHATGDDFLSIHRAYTTMQRSRGWT